MLTQQQQWMWISIDSSKEKSKSNYGRKLDRTTFDIYCDPMRHRSSAAILQWTLWIVWALAAQWSSLSRCAWEISTKSIVFWLCVSARVSQRFFCVNICAFKLCACVRLCSCNSAIVLLCIHLRISWMPRGRICSSRHHINGSVHLPKNWIKQTINNNNRNKKKTDTVRYTCGVVTKYRQQHKKKEKVQNRRLEARPLRTHYTHICTVYIHTATYGSRFGSRLLSHSIQHTRDSDWHRWSRAVIAVYIYKYSYAHSCRPIYCSKWSAANLFWPFRFVHTRVPPQPTQKYTKLIAANGQEKATAVPMQKHWNIISE